MAYKLFGIAKANTFVSSFVRKAEGHSNATGNGNTRRQDLSADLNDEWQANPRGMFTLCFPNRDQKALSTKEAVAVKFSKVGEVAEISIITGFTFVRFRERSFALQALELWGEELSLRRADEKLYNKPNKAPKRDDRDSRRGNHGSNRNGRRQKEQAVEDDLIDQKSHSGTANPGLEEATLVKDEPKMTTNNAMISPGFSDSQVEANTVWDAATPTRQVTGKPPIKPVAESTPKGPPSPRGFNVRPPILIEFVPFPLNKEVQVAITEVVSPALIWVQLVQEENIDALGTMMGKLAQMYSASAPNIQTVNIGEVYAAHQMYSDTAPNIQTVNIGEVYAAQFSDGFWYRAKAVAMANDEIKLHYIDFGNDDSARVEKLRQLDSSLLKFPAQAISLSIGGVSPVDEVMWRVPQDKLQAIITPNIVYKACATACRTSADGWMVYTVKMTSEAGDDVADRLMSVGLAERSSKKTPPIKNKTVDTSSKQPEFHGVMTATSLGSVAQELKVGQEIQVILTDATSPTTFTVQVISDDRIAVCDKFNDKLNTFYNQEGMTAHRPSQVGELVVVKYSGYAGWFRAEIMQLLDNKALVNYIDFGNSEEVQFSDIRKADPVVSTGLAAQAVKCQLYGVQPRKEWPKTILQTFIRICYKQDARSLKSVVRAVFDDLVTLEVFSKDGKSISIELDSLTSPKADVKPYILAHSLTSPKPKAKTSSGERVAMPKVEPFTPTTAKVDQTVVDIKPTALPLNGTKVHATVSYVYGMDSFFVVPRDAEQQARLESVMRELNQACNQSKAEYRPRIGEFVAAQFTDEGCTLWYRARVVQAVDGGKYKVLFVDYGNSETVSVAALRQLEPRLAELSQLAVHCQLASRSDDPEVQEGFRTIINMLFSVAAVREAGGVYTVRLYLETVHDLEELLVPAPESPAAAAGHTATKPPPAPLQVIHIVNIPLDGKRVEAKTMVIESMSSFYVQLMDTDLQTRLSLLMNSLNSKVTGEVDTAYEPIPGEYIAAQFADPSVGVLWYRAQLREKVQGQGDKIYKVFYVDYGNTDTVSRTAIRRLDAAAVTSPLMAVHCKLAGYSESKHKDKNEDFQCTGMLNLPLAMKAVSLESQGESDALYLIEMFLPDANKTCVNVVLFPEYEVSTSIIKSSSESKSKTLTRSDPGKSIGKSPASQPQPTPKQAVDQNSAKENATKTVENVVKVDKEKGAQLPVDGRDVAVLLAHVEGVACFYVQQLDMEQQRALAALTMDLATRFQQPAASHHPAPGDIVAAQYAERGEVIWYRARCLGPVASGKYKVHFVDYGNAEIISANAIQKLDAEFCKLPFMAVKCCLLGCSGQEGKEAACGLENYLNCQMELIAMKLVGDTYHVVLFNEGESVHKVLGISTLPPSPEPDEI